VPRCPLPLVSGGVKDIQEGCSSARRRPQRPPALAAPRHPATRASRCARAAPSMRRSDVSTIRQHPDVHRHDVPAHDAATAASERQAATRSFRVSLIAGGLAGEARGSACLPSE